MKDIGLIRGLIRQAHEHILKAQAFVAPLIRILKADEDDDQKPRLEKIAKAAAEIKTNFTFDDFVDMMNDVPRQLQAMIDNIVAIQFDWPMPEEGWKRFVEDVERTNERLGINLHINLPDHPDSLNITSALEKYAKSINKTRGELDENERKQAVLNAVLAKGEKSMTESPSYIMYTAEMIRLIKATLEGTIKPLVPFSASPLEFCEKAHEIKDELISNALGLLENDIGKFGQIMDMPPNWISVEERMPTEDALYLIHAPSLDPEKPFIKTAWFNPDNDMGWELLPKVWADAVTHWMLLPEPPKQIVVNGACAGCGLPLDGDHAPWCRTLKT